MEENDSVIELDSEDENDPELLAMKEQIKAVQSPKHQRESSQEISERLQKQIDIAAVKVLAEGDFINQPQEELVVEETKETDIDSIWETYVAEAGVRESQMREKASFQVDPPLEEIISTEIIMKNAEHLPDPFSQYNFLYDLLLERYRYHIAVGSDYGIKRILKDKEPLLKNPKSFPFIGACNECIKCYFLLGDYEKAYTLSQNLQKHYPLFENNTFLQGTLNFYLFKTGVESKRKQRAIEAEKFLLKALQKSIKEKEKKQMNLIIFYMLLILTLDCTLIHPKWKIVPCNLAQCYCSEIRKIDDYLGYIAWTELYIYSGKKEDAEAARDLLWELLEKDQNRPEAYLRIWTLYYKLKRIEKCIEISERLFLEGTEFEQREYTTIIVLLYVKSLFKSKHFLLCFQKLQFQYSINPELPIILYKYAKYICKSPEYYISNFFISAISALQECLRSCHPLRHGKILFYIGKLFEIQNDQIKAGQHFGQALQVGLPVQYKNYCEKYLQSKKVLYETMANFRKAICEGKEAIKSSKNGKSSSPAKIKYFSESSIKIIEKYDPNYAEYVKIMYAFFIKKERVKV